MFTGSVDRLPSKLNGALELYAHEEYEVEHEGEVIHVDFPRVHESWNYTLPEEYQG